MNKTIFSVVTLSLLLLSSSILATEKLEDKLYLMTFEELAQVSYTTSASLTRTEKKWAPAYVTYITAEDIRRSSARNLDELLEVYVPDFAQLLHISTGSAIGLRGINSDLADKVLIVLDGKVMNDKTIYGGLPERHLSMLGDIERVEVISGPGSALYGPGAIAGVVNILTKKPQGVEEGSFSFRQGFLEEYSTLELSYTVPIDDTFSFKVYYGMDYYQGARAEDAPFSIGSDIPGVASAGEVNNSLAGRSNGAYRGQPRYKLHLNLYSGEFETWLRFTSGGKNTQGGSIVWDLTDQPIDAFVHHGYRELTWMNRYSYEVNSELSTVFNFAYQENNTLVDFEDLGYYAYGEREYLFRNLWQWEASEDHSVAFGGEVTLDFFGETPRFFSGESFDVPNLDKSWNSRTYSLFGESQYRATDDFVIISGARIDRPEFSKTLFSPRLAFLWQRDEDEMYKLLLGRSVRKANDYDLRRNDLQGNKGDVETHDSIELIQEKKWSESLSSLFSIHYYQLDFISFDPSVDKNVQQGQTEALGLSCKLTYEEDGRLLSVSHSYTKLLNLSIRDPLSSQVFSSEPYGYGDDLANWSNHITKFYLRQDLTKNWSLDSSLRIFWGFPGGEDQAQYNREVNGDSPFFPQADGDDKAFDPSYYFDVGSNYKFKKWTFRIDAHNLLGWIDQDYNNRRFYGLADYRSQAAAFSLTASVDF